MAGSGGSLAAAALGRAAMDFTPAEEERAEVPGEPLPAVALDSPASLCRRRGGDGLWEQNLGLCHLPCSRARKPALLQPQLCQPFPSALLRGKGFASSHGRKCQVSICLA